MEKNEKLGVDDIRILWREYKSENGKTFKVGWLETGNVFKDGEMYVKPLRKENFGIPVTWDVADAVWKDTDSNVRAVSAITRYKLHRHNGGGYSYCLEFTNEAHYKYQFIDRTGDLYTVETFINRDHYLLYNSGKPEIICVKGS